MVAILLTLSQLTQQQQSEADTPLREENSIANVTRSSAPDVREPSAASIVVAFSRRQN